MNKNGGMWRISASEREDVMDVWQWWVLVWTSGTRETCVVLMHFIWMWESCCLSGGRHSLTKTYVTYNNSMFSVHVQCCQYTCKLFMLFIIIYKCVYTIAVLWCDYCSRYRVCQLSDIVICSYLHVYMNMGFSIVHSYVVWCGPRIAPLPLPRYVVRSD